MKKHLEVFNKLADDFYTVQQNHIGPVTLVLAEGKIEIQEIPFDRGNKLHLMLISKFELHHGLKLPRWIYIQKLCIKHFSQKGTT